MADKTRWNVENENFDYFFQKESSLMTEKQREVLPKELYFKLFNRGGKVDTTSTNKISFLAKLFILIKALRKRVIILIEDENEGMDKEQYFKYRELLKSRKYNTTSSEGLITDAVFVLGNTELMDTFHRLNSLSVSNAYNYLVSSKQVKLKNKTADYITHLIYITKFLTFYESNRKRISMLTGINFPEWLVLIALFNGGEMQGSQLYKSTYRYGFNSSATKIKQAFGTLQTRNYIQKHGRDRGAKMQITALGRSKVIEILEKFVLNC
jgi:hypothetical protein